MKTPYYLRDDYTDRFVAHVWVNDSKTNEVVLSAQGYSDAIKSKTGKWVPRDRIAIARRRAMAKLVKYFAVLMLVL